MAEFKTLDSGKREEFASGMVRDTEEGKVRYDLLLPAALTEESSMLIRWAKLLTRGAVKYSADNWLKADGEAEFARAKSSLWRHFISYIRGVDDGEDHAAAIIFNLQVLEHIKHKMKKR